MTWNTTWPINGISVRANQTPGDQNTKYISTTAKVDHFFNEGVDENGHHKYAQMVATNDADKTLATNSPLATAMDLMYFSRYKTTAESQAAIQQCMAYFKNTLVPGEVAPFSAGVMEILGIRACALWGYVGAVQTLYYAHNITNANLVNTAAGKFTATFSNPLPSDKYLFLGSSVPSIVGYSEAVGFCVVESPDGARTLPIIKTVNSISFTTPCIYGGSSTRVIANPVQGWFICFGG